MGARLTASPLLSGGASGYVQLGHGTTTLTNLLPVANSALRHPSEGVAFRHQAAITRPGRAVVGDQFHTLHHVLHRAGVIDQGM